MIKKILGIMVLSLLWCELGFALTKSNAMDSFFSDRKLSKIEGIWVSYNGMVEAFILTGNQIRTIRISGGSAE